MHSKFRYGKLIVLLTIVTLCCFLFAGAAMASPSSYDIYVPNGNPVTNNDTNIVKANTTYAYWLKVKLDPSVDVIALGNKPLDIVFPAGFDLSPAVGKTVQLVVTVGDRQQLMQIVPTISGQTATFIIQSQNLPERGDVRRIEIQGLSVTNPCEPGNYCVEAHSPCFDFNCLALQVVETVGSIKITEPVSVTSVVGGSLVTVKGEIRDACGDLWDYDTWPVIIDIVDRKGRAAMDGTDCEEGLDGNVICPVITHPVNGVFTATIKVPGQGYDYEKDFIHDYLIRARTLDVKDAYEDANIEYFGFTLNDEDLIPATEFSYLSDQLDWKGMDNFDYSYCFDSLYQHSWIEAAPQQVVRSIPGQLADVSVCVDGDYYTENGFIVNKPIDVTICGIDKFCRETDASGLKVDLLASQDGKQPTLRHGSRVGYVAGVFLDEEGNEISHVYVPAGESCVTVQFVPAVTGPITIEARTIIGGSARIDTADITVVSEYDITLEVLPIVSDDNYAPRAGWPLKASVWLQDQSGNVISASEHWEVKVGLVKGDWSGFMMDASWDTKLDVCYEATGTKRGYADFLPDGSDFGCWDETCFVNWDSYIHPYSTYKSHFYVYTPSDAAGEELKVIVGVFSKATGELLAYDCQEVDLVSPVELTRGLDAETWQTLSTPKYLANASDCTQYGTFEDLLVDYVWDRETLIMSYQGGRWKVLSPDSVVEPLQCYYIKTRQPLTPVGGIEGRNDYWQARYVFDRATSPSEMIPPIRELKRGWNSVGLTVDPILNNSTVAQADFLYHALGSICNDCKLLWNPGPKLGNLAQWKVASISKGTLPAWAMDPLYCAFNGDNYWLYVDSDDAILAANAGLELVDP